MGRKKSNTPAIDSGNPRRTKAAAAQLAILARRARIAELYAKGLSTIPAIAAAEGVSDRTAKYDLAAVREQLRESATTSTKEAKKLAEIKCDAGEFEAWQAWKLSKNKDGSGGDHRYMELALKFMERRCKLLGLDEPVETKNAHDVISGSVDGPRAFLRRDQMKAEIAERRKELARRDQIVSEHTT